MKTERKYKVTIPAQRLTSNELMRAADLGDGIIFDILDVAEAKITWKEGEVVTDERARAAGQVLKEAYEKDGHVGVKVELVK